MATGSQQSFIERLSRQKQPHERLFRVARHKANFERLDDGRSNVLFCTRRRIFSITGRERPRALEYAGEGAKHADEDGAASVTVEADEMRHAESIAARDRWVAWILDGVGRKRPVAPRKTGHAYPAERSGDLEGDERPETDDTTATRWAEFGLAELGLSLPDDAQSDGLDVGIMVSNDRPTLDEQSTLVDAASSPLRPLLRQLAAHDLADVVAPGVGVGEQSNAVDGGLDSVVTRRAAALK